MYVSPLHLEPYVYLQLPCVGDRTILHGGDQPAAPPRVHSNGVVDPAVAGGDEVVTAIPVTTSPHQLPMSTQGTDLAPSSGADDDEVDISPVMDDTASLNASTLSDVPSDLFDRNQSASPVYEELYWAHPLTPPHPWTSAHFPPRRKRGTRSLFSSAATTFTTPDLIDTPPSTPLVPFTFTDLVDTTTPEQRGKIKSRRAGLFRDRVRFAFPWQSDSS